jgi:hypothetical protein
MREYSKFSAAGLDDEGVHGEAQKYQRALANLDSPRRTSGARSFEARAGLTGARRDANINGSGSGDTGQDDEEARLDDLQGFVLGADPARCSAFGRSAAINIAWAI